MNDSTPTHRTSNAIKPDQEPRSSFVSRAARLEFKKWKATLIGWIKRHSTMDRNYDGSWTFLLPPKIVRLVWETTINERMKMQNISKVEAETSIRKELEDAEEKMKAIAMVQVAKVELEETLKQAKDGKITNDQAVKILVEAMTISLSSIEDEAMTGVVSSETNKTEVIK